MLRLDERAVPRYFMAALLVAISTRVILFFGSMIVPIPNEKGLLISPLTANTALDLSYYQWVRTLYFGESGLLMELGLFIEYFGRLATGNVTGKLFLPGPMFPGLLHLFDYGPDNSLPLSAVYLLLSVVLVAAWLRWLNRKGVGPIWLLVFAILPTPYWFMLNISTDLLFAVSVGAFWLLWLDEHEHTVRRMTGITVVVVIAALLRPNALSLLFYLCVDVLVWEVALKEQRKARLRGLLFAALIAVISLVFAVFYAPYLYWVATGSGGSSYFGWLPKQYAVGLWPDLPTALNLGLSWLSLAAAKILYLTGLRPSFGDTEMPLVILRMSPGVIMLPGLIWLLFRASWRLRFFVVLFLAPIVLGISQDRYVLPIQPILFYYGTKAWGKFAQLCTRSKTIAI